ncbi:unnamed protein product [Chrysodeixis includens]|uniref:WW domain-containing protein n=1 Tax=Chrysodeixis includens TaxID=689277 RepID=A0A9P0FUS4_CHRIL|nr:unnamed protein product [Chrysodeixis includens]
MSKVNPLAGLIGNYGDSDDESDDGSNGLPSPPGTNSKHVLTAPLPGQKYANPPAAANASAAVHPAPIPHCPWSACYDESSGFTYYWNQQTNAVTWEAPPEYLLALKVAQQQLHQTGVGEVSAEEWQLYQQALAEKQNTQNKVIAKSSIKLPKKHEKITPPGREKHSRFSKKRTKSDDDDVEKIELITSYHNSDSDSNDESESPVKTVQPPLPKTPAKPIIPNKKPKLKPQEYGPALPPNQNYTLPIGPELPPEINNKPKLPEDKVQNDVAKENKKSPKPIDEDSQDEGELFLKLKSKAKILEKLGGELPRELQKMIGEEPRSRSNTPSRAETPKLLDTNIDDILEEIEKKELPKIINAKKTDIFEEKAKVAIVARNPSPEGVLTPPVEAKPLFPSMKNIEEAPPLPPAPMEIEGDKKAEANEKKGVNLYLVSDEQRLENVGKKKLRISNSVLPDRKKTVPAEEPSYTTKYSQFIEGFSSERTGLGFTKEDDGHQSPKTSTASINYGNGLMFTKGETLNEEKKDEDLDDLTDLLEAKLKYLNQLQPCVITPVQEMMIQMQTLVSAFRAGAVSAGYWRRWAEQAARSLGAHEARAAPPGWSAAFQRSEGRYCYRREADGLLQWEYPATTHTDMDICTTPPHPGIEAKEESQPPLPPAAPVVSVPSPPPLSVSPPRTPPPPAWADPPPPGCDDPLPMPVHPEPKQEIGDELASFYSDIAELEKQSSGPHTASNSPEPVEVKERHRDKDRDRDIVKDKEVKVPKKKSKVKISASMGLKHKSVSNLVAKWQQVADEINSD